MYGQGEGVIQGTVLFVLTSEICTSNYSTINFNGMQLIIHADVYLSVSYGMCFIQAGLGRYFISMCIIVYLMIVFPLILTYIGIMSTTNGLIWYLRQTRGGPWLVIHAKVYLCLILVCVAHCRHFNHQWVNMMSREQVEYDWLFMSIYMYVCMYDIYIFVFLHCFSCRIGLIWRIKRGKSEAVVIEWQNKMTKKSKQRVMSVLFMCVCVCGRAWVCLCVMALPPYGRFIVRFLYVISNNGPLGHG